MLLKPDIGKAKGQQYDLPSAIRSFLRQMAEHGTTLASAVIKELIQNADDAGATELSVILDERTPPQDFGEIYHRILLPALIVRNMVFGDVVLPGDG